MNQEPQDHFFVPFRAGSPSRWYIRNADGTFYEIREFGQSTDKLVPGDYDGDGKTDLGVWRPSRRKVVHGPDIGS